MADPYYQTKVIFLNTRTDLAIAAADLSNENTDEPAPKDHRDFGAPISHAPQAMQDNPPGCDTFDP